MLKSCFSTGLVEAGCDETGRGCLAGPVVAAAVILPPDYQNENLDDSKRVSRKKRLELEVEIKEIALDWSVAEVDNTKIDEINILNASFLAMHEAVGRLKRKPELLLIDGNRFNPYPNIPHHCIIKGDGLYFSIAAASILAKTYRDKLMEEFGEEFPDYSWNTNVGYPTRAHRRAIRNIGPCHLHRLSFRLLNNQLELFEEINGS